MLSNLFVRWGPVVAALVILLLFTAIYLPVIRATQTGGELSRWTKNAARTGAATSLAGFIGGIVAVGFGVKVPRSAVGASDTAKKKLRRSFEGLGNMVPGPTPPRGRKLIAGLYTAVYAGIGGYAWVVWFFHPRPRLVPDVVDDFASVWLGLVIGAAYGIFKDPEDEVEE
jgi:hypothetical protein